MDSSTGPPTSTEEWLALLQKQEMVHQMELEKWHEMLGAATELLRKVKKWSRQLAQSSNSKGNHTVIIGYTQYGL